MPDLAEIVQRLTNVEAGLAQLQAAIQGPTRDPDWVEKVAGSLSFLTDEEYREFLDCCRQVREEADRQ